MVEVYRHPTAFVVCLTTAMACAPSVPTPDIDRVEPSWGFRGEDTPVQVVGGAFFPRVSASGSDDISVSDDFRVYLETTPPTSLDDVTRAADDTLLATVPAGIEPGRYTVRVVGPSGRSDRINAGFTVTDTQAATVALETSAVRFDVGQEARVGLQLADLSGNDVAQSIRVQVQAVAASGDRSSVVFQPGLAEQELVEPGVVNGFLDSGGGADLYFTSTEVDDVALRVVGLDLNSHIDVTSPQLRFEPASIEKVEITLEPGPYEVGEPVTVGLRLLDQDGNQTRGELLVATVQETCARGGVGYREIVTVADQAVISDVVFMGATVDGACDENRLQVVGVVGGQAITAETPPLQILPGELARYRVTPVVDTVIAGSEPQTLLVAAEDDWGNPVVDHAETLRLTDNLGGLDPDAGVGSAQCSDFVAGQAVCSAYLEAAGEMVAVHAVDANGVDGISRAFEVVAAAPMSLDVQLPSAPFEAGETFLVQTQARDEFGNPASLQDLGGSSALELSDTTGSLACIARFDGPAPGLVYSMCAVYTAAPAVEIVAAVPSTLLEATTPAFEVTNAALDEVSFELSASTVEAGAPLDFAVAAYDAYGNPYRVQAASNVIVDDSEGELASTSVLLDSEGMGTGTVTLTRTSTTNRLQGRVFGSLYGESSPIVIQPGSHAGYAVEVGEPWVAMLAERDVRIDAVDAYGNTLDDVQSTLSLVSLGDAADAVSALAMVDGTVTTTVTWDQALLQDQLIADDGTFSSSSGPVDSLDFECASGPKADLTLAGESDLRLCLVGGQTNAITVSAAGSQVGAASLAAYHFDLGTGGFARQAQPSLMSEWREQTAYLIQVVVADASACADMADARVWIGESDGEPVGPVDVAPATEGLIAGSSTTGATAVELAAWDCAGDPASGGTLHIRSTLGEVSAGGTAVSATGQGLAVVLDSDGAADITWSFVGDEVGGEAVVHAGTISGSAHGAATSLVSGDARLPRVVDYTPAGETDEIWSSIELGFDEDLYAESVVVDAFSLVQPDGTAAEIESVSLTAGRWVSVVPFTPMDGALGAWTLTVASSLRDDGGGNYLSGDWSGSAADLVLTFGDVTDNAPGVSSCTPDTPEFRPDGDDAVGVNADSVTIQAVASSVPEYWWVEVADDTGTVVQWLPSVGTSAAQSLVWDGRAANGLVVAPGRYTLSTVALDGRLARGSTCVSQVDVSQLVGPPVAP